MENLSSRPISLIAQEIFQDWNNVHYTALPYLNAMLTVSKNTDYYGSDSASSIVAYFLGNASSWRGEKARAIKKELNQIIK